MLRRGLHQPVARSRSHKKLGFERPTPFSEPARGSAKAEGSKRLPPDECTSRGRRVARPLVARLIKQENTYVQRARGNYPRSTKARVRLIERLPPLLLQRATRASRTSSATYEGPSRAHRIGAQARSRRCSSTTLGSTTVASFTPMMKRGGRPRGLLNEFHEYATRMTPPEITEA